MSHLTQLFLFQIESVCADLWSKHGQSLAALISTGKSQEALSWKLFHEYREWGLLHLLVLSGSQYYSFARAWIQLTQFIQKTFFKVSSPFWSRIFLVGAGLFYLQALDVPAPLLRCALLAFAYQFLAPLKFRKESIIFFVFLTHMTLDNFHPTDSTFLSWLAFFTLQISNSLSSNKVLRALCVTLTLHLSIGFYKELPFSFRSLLVATLSNLISLPLFERVLFPCIGYVSVGCLLLSPLLVLGLSPQYFKDYLAPLFSFILDLAILPVLVTNSAFRYTFSE